MEETFKTERNAFSKFMTSMADSQKANAEGGDSNLPGNSRKLSLQHAPTITITQVEDEEEEGEEAPKPQVLFDCFPMICMEKYVKNRSNTSS